MSGAGVLVLGGSGFVGRAVCEFIVRDAGGAAPGVVVPTRRPARAKHLSVLPGVKIVPADLHDDATLARLLDGCGAVVSLVAILNGSEADFERVHVELPRRIVAACRARGGPRIVHVGALGASVDAPSRYLRSKARGEAVLRESGLAVTVLRPSIVIGEHDRTTHLFAALQSWLPVVPLAGADAQVQPVWVDDVATAILRCLRDARTAGQVFELAGPRVMALRELVALAGRAAGHERRIVALPDWAARLQATLFELLPGEPLITRDNLASLTVPNVASGALPGFAALGIAPASVEDVLAETLGGAGGPTRLLGWRSRAHRA